MTINIAICDDEKKELISLCHLLDICSFHFNIDLHADTYSDAKSLLAYYREKSHNRYQLLFLDIEMPEVNGISLAEIIKKTIDHHVIIVFISNYPKYMQDSFSVHPYHFLQKPVSETDMKKLISDVIKEYTYDLTLVSVIDGYDREYTINLQNVYYIECKNAKSKQLCFHMQDTEIFAKGTITTWSDKLCDSMFIVCSRTVLVNITHIHYLKDCAIILDNGVSIQISRRKRKLITERYMNQVVAIHSGFIQ